MHGLAAFVMTIAIYVTKPRIRGGIKAPFGKSLFCPIDMGNSHLISMERIGENFAFLFEKQKYSVMRGGC